MTNRYYRDAHELEPVLQVLDKIDRRYQEITRFESDLGPKAVQEISGMFEEIAAALRGGTYAAGVTQRSQSGPEVALIARDGRNGRDGELKTQLDPIMGRVLLVDGGPGHRVFADFDPLAVDHRQVLLAVAEWLPTGLGAPADPAPRDD